MRACRARPGEGRRAKLNIVRNISLLDFYLASTPRTEIENTKSEIKAEARGE